jgi:hypothetical protein
MTPELYLRDAQLDSRNGPGTIQANSTHDAGALWKSLSTAREDFRVTPFDAAST